MATEGPDSSKKGMGLREWPERNLYLPVSKGEQEEGKDGEQASACVLWCVWGFLRWCTQRGKRRVLSSSTSEAETSGLLLDQVTPGAQART